MRVLFLSILLLCLQVGTDAVASVQNPPLDRVVLQPQYSAGKKVVRGRIVDYTGSQISIVEQDALETSFYPAGDVLRVETPQTAAYQQAMEQWNAGQYQEAERLLLEANSQESRVWVRRQILADLVRLSLRSGDYVNAAKRFKLLYQSDSTTQFYSLLPVVWSEKVIAPGQIQPAYDLLIDDIPAIRLVGASLLLEHDGFGGLAQKTLLALTKVKDTRVRALAKAQQWRLKLNAREVTPFTFNGWLRELEEIPAELRGGPTFLIARSYEQQLNRSEAVLAYLRVAMLYDDDRLLASRATLAAAELIESQGRTQESVTIYRELLTRYPETSAAREARASLKISE